MLLENIDIKIIKINEDLKILSKKLNDLEKEISNINYNNSETNNNTDNYKQNFVQKLMLLRRYNNKYF